MLPKLKHRQKLLNEECGTIYKDWGGRTRIALVFANRYSVGMSNLGFQSVYGNLNQFDNIVCERVFYPEPEELRILRENPGRLFSLESQRPLRDFDLIAFSIPYENDYPNSLEMLHLAGLPVRSDSRNENHPLIAGGGVALFLNPEPLAPFMDFIFIGEAEALIPDFLQVWNDTTGSKASRKYFLGRLAKEVPGIYVPSLYEVAYRQDGALNFMEPLIGSGAPERVSYRRADLSDSPPCQTVVRTPNAEFSDVTLLEIGRGCGRGCRFCAAGFVYRPLRVHYADKLLEAAKPAMADGPRLGLVSAAVSDHPEISFLCQSLLDMGGTLSFSSLRADTLSPEIAAALQASRHRSVAIAPEAGSVRMRRVINKNLSEEEIYRAAERLTEMGIIHLKLYFMIGLPTETMEDLEAIVDLAKGIKHHVLKISRGRKQLGTITLSIHSFVPKAFTPFQWSSFSGIRVLKDRARWIQRALQKVPNVRVHFDLPKWAYVQALLARGDRRVSQFLEKVGGGLSWMQALRETPHNSDFWVLREREQDERFPWEIIDYSIKRSYLWSEYQRALEGKVSPPCTLKEGCRTCGVCGP